MTLKEIAQLALAEDACPIPIDKCRSPNGPANCRVHCVEYFDRLCDSVSFEEAKLGLEEKYGIDVMNREKAVRTFTDDNILKFIKNETEPITTEHFKDSVKSLWCVIEDLTDRFPLLDIPEMIYVGAQPKNPKVGGGASVDRLSTKICFITFNVRKQIPDYKQEAYGHKDARLQYDIIRHEIGHSVMDFRIVDDWLDELNRQITQLGERKVRLLLAESISLYAGYGANWKYDSFAEAFSKFTSHDYESGMPQWIEKFLYKQFKGEPHD